MSHFTVLVIGPNPEEQLAPFQENNMGDCPAEYLEFYDTTEDVKDEWDNLADEDKQKYEGIDAFAEDQGYQVRSVICYPGMDPEATPFEYARLYGYMTNPNSQWDWYELGGRWTGFFKIKDNPFYAGKVGEPGLCTDHAKPGYADAALKRAIDFDGMREDEAKESLARFDKTVEVINGRKYLSFPEVRDRVCGKDEDFDKDKLNQAREEYHAQPVVKDLSDANLRPWFEDVKDVYCNFDRERYEQYIGTRVGVTHAVLMDGEWMQRGRMGMWATVHGAQSKEDWAIQIKKLIEGLPDDTLLSVYDCHV